MSGSSHRESGRIRPGACNLQRALAAAAATTLRRQPRHSPSLLPPPPPALGRFVSFSSDLIFPTDQRLHSADSAPPARLPPATISTNNSSAAPTRPRLARTHSLSHPLVSATPLVCFPFSMFLPNNRSVNQARFVIPDKK